MLPASDVAQGLTATASAQGASGTEVGGSPWPPAMLTPSAAHPAGRGSVAAQCRAAATVPRVPLQDLPGPAAPWGRAWGCGQRCARVSAAEKGTRVSPASTLHSQATASQGTETSRALSPPACFVLSPPRPKPPRSFLLPTGTTLTDRKGLISSHFATKPPHGLATPGTWARSSGSSAVPQSQPVHAGCRSRRTGDPQSSRLGSGTRGAPAAAHRRADAEGPLPQHQPWPRSRCPWQPPAAGLQHQSVTQRAVRAASRALLLANRPTDPPVTRTCVFVRTCGYTHRNTHTLTQGQQVPARAANHHPPRLPLRGWRRPRRRYSAPDAPRAHARGEARQLPVAAAQRHSPSPGSGSGPARPGPRARRPAPRTAAILTPPPSWRRAERGTLGAVVPGRPAGGGTTAPGMHRAGPRPLPGAARLPWKPRRAGALRREGFAEKLTINE